MEMRPAYKLKRGGISLSNPPILKLEVNENVIKEEDNKLSYEDFVFRVFY